MERDLERWRERSVEMRKDGERVRDGKRWERFGERWREIWRKMERWGEIGRDLEKGRDGER